MFSDREHHITSSAINTFSSRLAERYAINGHRVILYAGTFEAYQGLDLLVDASKEIVRTCKNIRFLCIGGNGNQVDKMTALAGRHGVGEYFIFPGTMAPEEVQSLVKIASILISPRTSGTNTPLKIYSYLRSGVPIVATKIVSHTQVLTDDVALLVEPHPSSISRGVLRLLEDTELSKRLAQNALQLATKSYSQDEYQRKVAEVFSFLAGKAR
ncbi:MAG TPA: glycosyltransferase family 4 protein [Candidatus Binatia bacterium]